MNPAPVSTQGAAASSGSGSGPTAYQATELYDFDRAWCTAGRTFDSNGGSDTGNASVTESSGTITVQNSSTSGYPGLDEAASAARVEALVSVIVTALIAAGETQLQELADDLEANLWKWSLILRIYDVAAPSGSATTKGFIVGWGEETSNEYLGITFRDHTATEYRSQFATANSASGASNQGTQDEAVLRLTYPANAEFDGDSSDVLTGEVQLLDGGTGIIAGVGSNNGGFDAPPYIVISSAAFTGTAAFSTSFKLQVGFAPSAAGLAALAAA